MRMVIAKDLWPAPACCAMRIDEDLRIDFEMRMRCGVDIGGRLNCADVQGGAKQQAAAFVRMRSACVREERVDYLA